MTQIQKQLDRIVVGLKHIDSLKDVRFVREYGSHSVETPITGFLAVVSVRETVLSNNYIGGYLSSSVRGDQYSANAEIRVYAPATENGAGLSEVVGAILSGLKDADKDRIVTETSATPIAFDSDMNAIYRTVKFGVDFCLCEEG